MLISGGGIAGATLGFWLARSGWEVTVVERAQAQRSSGNPVDVRGDALGIVGEMGLLDRLRASATTARRAVVVGADGSPRARSELPECGPTRQLHEGDRDPACRPRGCTGRGDQLRDGRALRREHHRARDARRRRRRHLSIRPTRILRCRHRSRRRALQHQDHRVRTRARAAHLSRPLRRHDESAGILHVDPDEIQIYNEPGRMVSIHPGRNSPIIAYMFRRPRAAGFDPDDTAAHKTMIAEAFGDTGWRTPQLLEHTRAASDVYLDAITRVTMPSWHTGRVALAGDAASCVSLLGDGSTKAIIGARTLAAEASGPREITPPRSVATSASTSAACPRRPRCAPVPGCSCPRPGSGPACATGPCRWSCAQEPPKREAVPAPTNVRHGGVDEADGRQAQAHLLSERGRAGSGSWSDPG